VSEQSSVKEALEKALQDGLKSLKEALDLPALEALRNTYLSKKGIFTAHMQALAKASAEERPQLGKIINDAKTRFQQALQEKMDAFKEREMAEKLASERVDVSLAGRQAFKGGLHPVTLTRRRIEDWFAAWALLSKMVLKSKTIFIISPRSISLNIIRHGQCRIPSILIRKPYCAPIRQVYKFALWSRKGCLCESLHQGGYIAVTRM